MFEETEVCIHCGRPVDGYVFLEVHSCILRYYVPSINLYVPPRAHFSRFYPITT